MVKKAKNEADYIITIKHIPPVAFAVPGIQKVRKGETVAFYNDTPGEVRIRMAASYVLAGLGTRCKKPLASKRLSKPYKVLKDSGTHEISVHYSYDDETKNDKLRTGFAIGASSPKIIVVR